MDQSDATFTVTSGEGGGDVDAPVVSAVTVLPGSVVTGESVEVTWRLTDASGVQGTSANVSGPSGSHVYGCSLGAMQVSGTTKDGVWSLICQIPATSAVGTYTVQIYASDVAGNSRSLPMDQSDATFTVTSGGGRPLWFRFRCQRRWRWVSP